ncbi:MAG: tRNA dihydrouridine synthase DusB [Gemmatimonadota bacterium]|nr:tRNA dihydrouridine synthase DusB [Gemmatimonadota bacterium]
MNTLPFSVPGDPDTPLFLAPQAGVSESPFRRLCRSFGADVVLTEFVSAEGIVRGSEKTASYLRFHEEERPIGVQIFGADPATMGEAASLVTETYAPDFVDINFGCPVKKVVKRNGGSGCLRDLKLVGRIIRAVDRATPLPVTVKIRSGFDEPTRDAVAIGRVCQDAGARMVTLHPRTRADMYSGKARWEEIAALVRALEIPVIGNGDVRRGEDALAMRDRTGCRGIMIARGSHGAPWLFRQSRAALEGEPVPGEPDLHTRFEICIRHAANAVAFERDAGKAVREFRKHLGWYTKGIPDGRQLRQRLFQVHDLQEVCAVLEGYLDGCRDEDGAILPAEAGVLPRPGSSYRYDGAGGPAVVAPGR